MSESEAVNQLEIQALHAAYRAGTLTPVQLIEMLYARIEREQEPGIWIAKTDIQAALAQAQRLGPYREEPALPLFGVPFTIKDSIDLAGVPTTAGCPAFAYVPSRSAPAVERVLEAGAICLGKVNLDQFATGLVGTRSPYGACRNVFDPAYLSGGSSSGSAVSVARHYASFSLATDTAGSGRVPAALNNVVGLKPSRGLFDTTGVVPACASLDCLSVFTCSVADAALVRAVILGRAAGSLGALLARGPARVEPLLSSEGAEARASLRIRCGVPEPLEFFDDEESALLFERTLARLRGLGAEIVPVDFAPFRELGELLYGAFVVERLLGVGAFIEAHPDDVLPVVRDIILGGERVSGRDAFRAFARLEALRTACRAELERTAYLLTPTVPRTFTRAADQAEPRAINDKLGYYTRFVNFLGCPVLSIPQDFRSDGLPFGVSLLAPSGKDAELDALADHLHRASDAGAGRERHALYERSRVEAASPHEQDIVEARAPAREQGAAERTRSEGAPPRAAPSEARLAVVGAHMRGLALHRQLSERDARYVATLRTAPLYRLFVLPQSQPERPGLVRCSERGVPIEIELWDLSWHALGELMSQVPSPLAIGTLETEDGERVKGFLCESYAVEGARDISALGGYRAYLASK